MTLLRWILTVLSFRAAVALPENIADLELDLLFDLPLPPGCEQGSYRNGNEAVAPWKSGCPGFSVCEPGFWCDGTSKFTCPAGRFGSAYGLRSAACSGPCLAGHWCPTHVEGALGLTVGARSPIERVCGHSGVFCREGAAVPVPVSPGHYTVGNDADFLNSTRVSQQLCPVGHYCAQGILYQCPGGRYGAVEGLTTPQCSGECYQGYYCPAGSTSPTQFACGTGPNVFCPPGSDRPTGVYAGLTYEAPGGTGGFFSRAESPAGVGNPPYFDESGITRVERDSQDACPMGHYCVDGVRYLCPAGRFGNQIGQTTAECSGICEQGYYCPPGSVSPRQLSCGGNAVYCPTGSATPTNVSIGFYTVGSGDFNRFSQAPCEPGWYCTGGEKFLCRKGFYGAEFAQSSAACSGACSSGYYCHEGSTSPTEYQCGGPDVFCVTGSSKPVGVSEGYYTIRVIVGASVSFNTSAGQEPWFNTPSGVGTAAGSQALTGIGEVNYPPGSVRMPRVLSHLESLDQFSPPQFFVYVVDSSEINTPLSPILARIDNDTSMIRNWEVRCDDGSYCVNGQRFPCSPGRYGNERGLITSECSGACAPGYYCPVGSSRATQEVCGNTGVYCPEGSFEPTPVTRGYFTTGGTNESTRFSESICPEGHYCEFGVIIECPPGRYGATQGLSSPDCTGPCSAGYYCPSASTSATQVQCGGVGVYCPLGSGWPIPVTSGHYTAGGRHTYTDPGKPMDCRWRYSEALLYGLQGTQDIAFDATRYCISGLVGDNDTRSTQVECEPGHFCVGGLRYECPPGRYGSGPLETNPSCTGGCRPGFYCPWASTSPEQVICGRPDVYCPERSGFPVNVSEGYYTKPDRFPDQRAEQVICEPGHFCIAGLKYQCPSGVYGATSGLFTSSCTDICSAGYYCPIASVKPDQVECGGVQWYCPPGSSLPKRADPGYFTVGITAVHNNTQYDELPCNPGFFCIDGNQLSCPPGYWGSDTFMSDPHCMGLCDAGYFCPPGSLSPQAYRCGDVFMNTSEVNTTVMETYLSSGNLVGAGSAGAVLSGSSVAVSDPAVFVPWFSGFRMKLPVVNVFIDSVASIDVLHLNGGPSSVFCPRGSQWPTPVKAGYYTVGGDPVENMTRVDQVKCEPGQYCVAGIRQPCSPGTYGRKVGERSRQCTAACPAGFYCPIGSPAPIECPDNYYSTGGAFVCSACPSAPIDEAVNEMMMREMEPMKAVANLVQRCKNARSCCNL